MRPGRVLSIGLVVFVVLLVNVPFLHSRYLDWRLDRDGVDVTMSVTDQREQNGGYLLELRFPQDVDPEQQPLIVVVTQTAYDEATTTGSVPGRRLPGDLLQVEVEGEVTSSLPLFFTIFADVALAAGVVLFVRFRGHLRPELVLRATQDLERCKPGSVLDRIEGNSYVVAGEVLTIEDDEVVLDLGDRLVRVVLDGHANPAGHQQPVQATGVMIA